MKDFQKQAKEFIESCDFELKDLKRARYLVDF